MPLTADRAKPAVPFGGIYRLIDFALSNVVNSGYLKVVVLTQYKSHSLDRHVTKTWRMSTMLGNYVAPIPAQQRIDKSWYQGSADAIFQSLNTITDEKPDIVVVVGADHVYRMDFSQMVEQHIESGAGVTVAAIRQPKSTCRPVRRHRGRRPTTTPGSRRSARSRPTPTACPTRPTRSSRAWATTSSTPTRSSRPSPPTPPSRAASTTWAATSSRPWSSRTPPTPTTSRRTSSPAAPSATWATGATSGRWTPTSTPTWTSSRSTRSSTSTTTTGRSTPRTAPTRRRSSSTASHGRFGEALNSAVSPGVVISGARVNGSVVSPDVKVHSYTEVDSSVILDGVEIGRHCSIQRAVIDKNVVVPDGREDRVRPRARPRPRLLGHRVGHHRRRQGPEGQPP